MTEPAPPPRPRLGVIANPHPELDTQQEHVLELPELCPHSHNPGPGSTLSIQYTAGPWFLELFALEACTDSAKFRNTRKSAGCSSIPQNPYDSLSRWSD